ncbi:MAG: dihydropyrimidinase [Clostridia bacterium]|nr:dihydropyrimidinase [Clostridia bacterium]
MSILIRNGLIVSEGRSYLADVYVDGGIIKEIAPHIDREADELIDARGMYVMAGFIDTHTHFDLDLGVTVTADNFETGSAAAVVGGTTTVLDFATQDRGMTMQDALDVWHKKAQGASCNYGFHMAVSEWNEEREKEVKSMMAQGVTSFKMYMVYDSMKVDDGKIYSALKLTSELGCLIGVHCENYDVLQARIAELKAEGKTAPKYHAVSRPNAVEAEGVARLMRIGELAKAPVWVVHLSTLEGLEEARRARARGQEVYLETCPQYLVLNDSEYEKDDAEKFIMSPPLRHDCDKKAILDGLMGDIDFIGTDHCSFTMEQKALGNGDFSKVPNGGAGVQNRAELVHTYCVKSGDISIERMAELLSENAAKIFGMYPQKGCIRVGSDADIVIFDPNDEHVISYKTNLHNCDNSPYEGIRVVGRCKHVLVNGVHAVRDGLLTERGRGKYVFRKAGIRTRK